MGKSALRFLVVTGFLMVTVFAEDVYVTEWKTWPEAQAYCREHYTDLSTINSLEEDNALLEKKGNSEKKQAWIGLYKDDNDIWMWSSGGRAEFFNWISPLNQSEESNKCVVQTKRGWRKKKSKTTRHFYCFHSEESLEKENQMILVKKNLPWEEAMEFCRHQGRELVSLYSESALNQVLDTILGAQTNRVWTGLRYLGDTWLWVGKGEVTYKAWGEEEMPHCPAWERHCGTVSLGKKQWESWDCADKLNFVCH